MKAIVTVVLEGMKKGIPKAEGFDILKRYSTDVGSRHKSVLIETESLDGIGDIEQLALEKFDKLWSPRISRIEILEW
jgi:hypothetical protein